MVDKVLLFPRVVIAGYFGFGNTGDEMILSAMIQDFTQQIPGVMITVVSGNPKSTSQIHHQKAISWSNYQEIVDAVQISDLVILGGGGLFHDYWGVDTSTIFTSNHIGISFYSTIAFLSSVFQKKLMLYAVGVGPILTDNGKRYIKAISEQASVISVRDIESKRELTSLGILPAKITITADATYSDSRFSLAQRDQPDPENPVVGVALRNWDVGIDPSSWEKQVAGAIDLFLDFHQKSRVVFIPFQVSEEKFLNDNEVAKRIKSQLRNAIRTKILSESLSFSKKLNIFTTCDLVLGMRLHSLILAFRNQIPAIGLIYDPKNRNELAQFSMQKNGIDLAAIDSSALFLLMEATCQNKDSFRTQLGKIIPELAQKVKKNTQLVCELLRNDTEPHEVIKNNVWINDSILNLSKHLDEEKKRNVELTTTNELLKKSILDHVLIEHDLEQRLVEYKAQKDKDDLKNHIYQGSLESEIKNIKQSRGWKLLWSLWQMRKFFAPPGSKTERFYLSIIRFLSFSLQKFKKVFNKITSGHFICMSRYAFVFRLYKSRRQKIWPKRLNNLFAPCQPGLVSIVLPVFNGDKYLEEAIDSILQQTYQHFELIVINDGSTDNSGLIADHFAKRDNRVRVVHQENQKLPRSLNNGFSLSKGEYFTWTSHDNILKPNFLERMVSCLSKHPFWEMVYANMDLIDEEGCALIKSNWFSGYQVPKHSEHIHLPTDTSELNTWPNNFVGGAFLYRKRVNDLLAGYSEAQITREDYDYWMQVNAFFTLKHVDFRQPIYQYRFHSASLTSQDEELRITQNRKFLMIFEDFRRDFCLMPMIWILDEPASNIKEHEMYQKIKNILKGKDQILIDKRNLQSLNLPYKWFPCVFLHAVESVEGLLTPMGEVDGRLFKVLISSEHSLINDNLSGECDLRLLLEENEKLDLDFSSTQKLLTSADLEALLHGVDIASRSQKLRQIEQGIDLASASTIKISVVICTYKRKNNLERSIRAISHQTISQDEYEVIVVDNNPEFMELQPFFDILRSQEFTEYPDHLRLVHCPLIGLSFARNAGLSEASGELILFLDDDSVANPDLLERYLGVFSVHQDVGLIGGHIILQRDDNPGIVWKSGWERYWSHFETDFCEFTKVEHWWEYPWGANWCAKRKVLFQIGGFRGNFGRHGNDFNGGEEIVAASLIQKLGYAIGILPQAVVTHEVERTRFTLTHLQQTIQAGKLVHYKAQVDLYLPYENGLRGMNKIRQTILNKTNSNDLDEVKADRLERKYIFFATIKLLFYKVKVELSRVRFLFSFFRTKL